VAPRVIGVLRRFLPEYLRARPSLTPVQWRAIRAITQCRTPALGGHHYACGPCGEEVFAFHSCNHKACPQCGREATREWVGRELAKRVNAPYFMVTFTLPSELRGLFFGPLAKAAYDIFFAAAAQALGDCLANPKWLGAATSGFTAILHTWNQQILFHPHLHVIVPAAGIDAGGRVISGKSEKFLAHIPALQACFRHQFRQRLKALDWEADPAVWHTDWGVNIRPFGSGEAAIKYLGAYVCRTAIADSRLVESDAASVTFRWKNRDKGDRIETSTIPGVEFVRRYLRHVLPRKMHSIRHYGFCHPAAKAKRERVAFQTGMPLVLGTPAASEADEPAGSPSCPCCRKPMTLVRVLKAYRRFMPWPRYAPPNKAPPRCSQALLFS
jgi:hypothetical protein